MSFAMIVLVWEVGVLIVFSALTFSYHFSAPKIKDYIYDTLRNFADGVILYNIGEKGIASLIALLWPASLPLAIIGAFVAAIICMLRWVKK